MQAVLFILVLMSMKMRRIVHCSLSCHGIVTLGDLFARALEFDGVLVSEAYAMRYCPGITRPGSCLRHRLCEIYTPLPGWFAVMILLNWMFL